MKHRFRQLYLSAHLEDLYADRMILKAFPEVVSQSHLNAWHPGSPIAEKGKRILVGVAPGWAELDIKLLDALDNALAEKGNSDYHIDVFDISVCERIEDLKAYLPDLKSAYHTPLVGIWEDGVFQKSLGGYAGRMFLAELFGFVDEFR
jgi:hypothetical protein